MKASLKPDYISDDVWNAIYPNLVAGFGHTMADFEEALAADANYLSQLGESITSVAQLLAIEVERADAEEPTTVLSTSEDLAIPTAGLPLSLIRYANQSIAGRYQIGDFGYGWTFLGDDSAATDAATGNILIRQGSLVRTFTKQTNGIYDGAPGDAATLVIVSGNYVLSETDGNVETFNPDGSFHSLADSNGNSITAAYQGGHLSSLTHSSGASIVFTENAQGHILTATASTGQIVTYTYDATGNYLLSASSADGTVSYSYDTDTDPTKAAQEHALTSITHPDGTHTFFTYDSLGRLTNEQGDNGTGSLTFTYFSPGGYTQTVDATGATTTVLYNERGQNAVVKDPLGNIIQSLFDANGNIAETIQFDNQGNVTNITSGAYNALGDQIDFTDALGSSITSTYNGQFNTLSSFQDANSNVTAYTENNQGDLTQIVDAAGNTTQFVPNPNGEVQQIINADGQDVSFAYNSFGEVTSTNLGNGVVNTFTYDGRGNLLSATDAGGTTTFEYNDPSHPDLVTKVTYPNDMFLGYSYDLGGRLKQLNQNGYIVNYEYDSAGRLTSLTDSSNATIVIYQYNNANQVIREDMGNGTYTTYTYDLTGHVQSLINYAPNGTVNSSFIYTYDTLGRVATMTTLDGTTTYGYDADSQLTSVKLPSGEIDTYAYDAMGNRTMVTENGVTTGYATNDLNQYTSAGAATYSYDKDGNLTVTTGSGGSTVYTYDSENRLTKVQTATDTWTYTYDALGNRIASSHNGQTTQYLVNPTGLSSVVGTYDSNGNLIANYTQGLGLVSQVTATGAAYYYNFDAVGSTVGISGANGSYVNSYKYLPFGQVQQSLQTVANPFQFNGLNGVMQDGNGLIFMRARYYDPSLGASRVPTRRDCLEGARTCKALPGTTPSITRTRRVWRIGTRWSRTRQGRCSAWRRLSRSLRRESPLGQSAGLLSVMPPSRCPLRLSMWASPCQRMDRSLLNIFPPVHWRSSEP